jgi:tRNA U55 pseudouridine synthase TruB
VLLVDKPKGWTSFDVCNAIKKPLRQLGVKKVGQPGHSEVVNTEHQSPLAGRRAAC